MLVLGYVQTTDVWREAGIEVDLIPLDDDVDRRLLEETTREVRDENGRLIDVRRDVVRYNQLVGRHCIKGWRRVVDAAGKPVECTPKAIDEFMTIEPAARRYVAMVKDLRLRVRDEVEQAKKD